MTAARIVCSREQRTDWLRATIGGLGLTGVIVDLQLQLRRVESAWMDSDTQVFDTLGEFFALSDSSQPDWEYTVAWIDCLHGRGRTRRGVYSRANHAAARAAPAAKPTRSVPLTPPISLVNGITLRAFNNLYFERQRRRTGAPRRAPAAVLSTRSMDCCRGTASTVRAASTSTSA